MTNQSIAGYLRVRLVQTGEVVIVNTHGEESTRGWDVHATWNPKYIHGTYARAGMKMPAVE